MSAAFFYSVGTGALQGPAEFKIPFSSYYTMGEQGSSPSWGACVDLGLGTPLPAAPAAPAAKARGKKEKPKVRCGAPSHLKCIFESL